MSTRSLRLSLCALSLMFFALSGCQDSLTTTGTADNDSGAAETPAETVVADTTTSEGLEATTDEPAGDETPDADVTQDEPMPEEPTEVAAVTPVVPDEPTVPATPEPEAPTEPEEPQPLAVGDAAPPLTISEWVMGEPIDQLASGQVYVVEFWATWCGPCKVSMPHMSEMQEHYGDEVQFVGVTREDIGTVQGFLGQEQSEGKTWNEVVKYRLAIDLDDTMNQTYMRAAGQNGIPTAFIVGTDGVVEWIGHPMAMEEPLAKVVAGDWDRAAAIAAFEQEKLLDDLRNGLNTHLRAQEFDEALALIDQFQAESGPSPTVTGYKVTVLQMAGKTEEANSLQAEVVQQNWDDSAMLNGIAWNIAIGRAPGELELALRAAERASELTNHEDASVLDTVARVHHEMGDLEKAVEWQTKAVAQDSENPQLAATLKGYQDELAEKSAEGEPTEGEAEGEPTEEGAADAPAEGESTPEDAASTPAETAPEQGTE